MSSRPLSYSSWSLWRNNPEKWVVKYLTDRPKEPQTQPMALGSAFDARVKGYICKCLGMVDNTDELYELQVDPTMRSVVWQDSLELFRNYQKLGCVAYLLKDMEGAIVPPVFEHSITHELRFDDASIYITGKPDVFYVNRNAMRVVLDWKVNGYYSASRLSPTKGYVWRSSTGRSHRDVTGIIHRGMLISVDGLDSTWASQMTIYAWLSGASVGEEFGVGIDQLIKDEVIRHRARVTEEYQLALWADIAAAYMYISTEWYLPHLTKEESKERVAFLIENWYFS